MAPAHTIWLSLPPGDIDGLPEGPVYHYWDGGPLPPGIEKGRMSFSSIPT